MSSFRCQSGESESSGPIFRGYDKLKSHVKDHFGLSDYKLFYKSSSGGWQKLDNPSHFKAATTAFKNRELLIRVIKDGESEPTVEQSSVASAYPIEESKKDSIYESQIQRGYQIRASMHPKSEESQSSIFNLPKVNLNSYPNPFATNTHQPPIAQPNPFPPAPNPFNPSSQHPSTPHQYAGSPQYTPPPPFAPTPQHAPPPRYATTPQYATSPQYESQPQIAPPPFPSTSQHTPPPPPVKLPPTEVTTMKLNSAETDKIVRCLSVSSIPCVKIEPISKQPESRGLTQSVHSDCICSTCSQVIVGNRFTCLSPCNQNFCSKCEEFHEESHPLYRFTTPGQAAQFLKSRA